MDNKSTIKLQAEEHEIINDSSFASIEEYVIHLMHLADYEAAQKVATGKVVLDFGCNCGYGTKLLSQTCNHVTGVDVSPSAIEAAKAQCPNNNVAFQLIDGITLPFESATFDVVTSFQVVEHVADYDTYLSEIRRVLKPEGVLLLTTPNAEIRVKPGAKPWNRFHVYEFRGDELMLLLQRYFPLVKVLGQVATAEAYAIEFNRCIKARDRVETTPQLNLKRVIVKYIPKPIANVLRSFRARLNPQQTSPLSEQARNRFSTADFFYRDSELDKALSLVATCTFRKTEQKIAAQAYQVNG
ncbi:MAG: 2-polyprenyl-3-methyl-5-hydroxy-6-metoxy-1,4-benzoquinol methylase [Arenicella sp.]|jgi:2-polyprenyl-3-methyl-5-hydroxy-6-metoxy-1,4-benzoquinol methylase